MNGSNFPVTATTTKNRPQYSFSPKVLMLQWKESEVGNEPGLAILLNIISICLTSLETEGLCQRQAHNKKNNHLVRRKPSLYSSSITSPDLTITIAIWIQGTAVNSGSCTMMHSPHLPLQSFQLVWSLLSCNLPITVCVLWAHVKFLFNIHHFSHSCRCIWLFFNR